MKFFILFFPVFLFAQQKITPQYIDKESDKLDIVGLKGKAMNGGYLERSAFILRESKKIHYSKGIALGYIHIASYYSNSKNYKKELENLKLAMKEEYTGNNPDFQIRIKRQLASNYYNMGLYREAMHEVKENVILADEIPVDTLRIFDKSRAYCEIGVIYKEQNRLDSCRWYLKKGIDNVLQYKKKRTTKLEMLFVFYSLGLVEIDIMEKKIDSAEIRLKTIESRSKWILGNNSFQLYKVKGMLNEHKKEYDSAVFNYQNAIYLAKNVRNIIKIQDLYNNISRVYQQIGKKDSATKYFQKYITIKDSLGKAKQPAIENTVQELVTLKENKVKAKNKFLLYGIWIGIFSVIIFVVFTIRRIRKKNKILNVKEEETKLLNQKLNVSFEEVIQLAKNNDPEFLIRFQEVYPEFFPKLLKIEPQLMNTELKFCALLFLNFSTKNIAAYTFVQPQSIQTRKHRLRKKLNIPSDIDIYIWMKNINSIEI
ncbi:tetratricopeptide repeat protein [Chryseobacterium rhizosphaerae]|uniref:Tetratricopeptide repeat protein n=1 Tax=Chryseobacterium rhizosphaerae TaxID=395937 RepID=A0ABX9IFP4_9FLAO|nr:hypothetical protein [Chryseobacterium rhizosphaerae]REC69231.1 hypothetical protein DRF57_23155 [Chryseobacterium rhizosphaerae]GEN69623.1 hypothetical protein CRH01_41910 [Chryseobacterium rhizosphaerae]